MATCGLAEWRSDSPTHTGTWRRVAPYTSSGNPSLHTAQRWCVIPVANSILVDERCTRTVFPRTPLAPRLPVRVRGTSRLGLQDKRVPHCARMYGTGAISSMSCISARCQQHAKNMLSTA
eukprot:scaffold132370_cov18-Prasinocladus_malaysianus.AAC.1